MEAFINKDVKVSILGRDYQVKELSLAQKIKVLSGVSGFIQDIAKNAFFKKSDSGNITFNLVNEITLAELNIDKIIMNAINILPELLALSIPDFTEWDNLPETQSREALAEVLKVNDFMGFIANFISLATSLIR